MSRQKKIKVESLEVIKVVDQDLTEEYGIDGVALKNVERMEKKVSMRLVELMKDMLLGFNEDMQVEIAEDLQDFAFDHVMHTTGCHSADAVLAACYTWIAEEQGIVLSRHF